MSQCTSHRRNTVQGTLPCPWCELETARAALAAVTAEKEKAIEARNAIQEMANAVAKDRAREIRRAITAEDERNALKAERDTLARKLNESRVAFEDQANELRIRKAMLSAASAGIDNVWVWQGQGDEPQTLTCPVVMSADTLRDFVAVTAERDALRTESENLRGCIADHRNGIAEVIAERDALRVTHKELHRRAQAAEGADARTARIEASSKRLLDRVRRNYVRIIRFRKRLYRDAVAQLLAAGVPDHVDGKPYPEWRTGYLDVLIGRLVAERDDLRAKAADAKQVAMTAQADPMTTINDRATALILRDKVKHLEDALREAGNLARALEQQVRELKVEVSWLKRYHVCKMDRTGPDTLFCYGCRTEMNEPEDK